MWPEGICASRIPPALGNHLSASNCPVGKKGSPRWREWNLEDPVNEHNRVSQNPKSLKWLDLNVQRVLSTGTQLVKWTSRSEIKLPNCHWVKPFKACCIFWTTSISYLARYMLCSFHNTYKEELQYYNSGHSASLLYFWGCGGSSFHRVYSSWVTESSPTWF